VTSTAKRDDAWASIVFEIKGMFDNMVLSDIMTKGNGFYLGMDAMAHVSLECTRIVKCVCENNSIETDTMLSLQYHAALMTDGLLSDYEKNRFATWGARRSPEAMSLEGFE